MNHLTTPRHARLNHRSHRARRRHTYLTPTGVGQMRCSDRRVAALTGSYTKTLPSTTCTWGRRPLPRAAAPAVSCLQAHRVGPHVKRERRSSVVNTREAGLSPQKAKSVDERMTLISVGGLALLLSQRVSTRIRVQDQHTYVQGFHR